MSAIASSVRAPVAVRASKSTPLSSRRVSQVRVAPRVAPKTARMSTKTYAREQGMSKEGKSVTFAGEDGKLWVCQGCGYIYDGSLGKWAEEKRCPACGERRFALKSEAEMNIAIGGLAVAVGLIGLLFLLVKVA